jgi:hypothetical protein
MDTFLVSAQHFITKRISFPPYLLQRGFQVSDALERFFMCNTLFIPAQLVPFPCHGRLHLSFSVTVIGMIRTVTAPHESQK